MWSFIVIITTHSYTLCVCVCVCTHLCVLSCYFKLTVNLNMHIKANIQATYLGTHSKFHHHSVTTESQTRSVTHTSTHKLILFYMGSLTRPQCPTHLLPMCPRIGITITYTHSFRNSTLGSSLLTLQLCRGSHGISTVSINSDNYVVTPLFLSLWDAQCPKQRRRNTYSYIWY